VDVVDSPGAGGIFEASLDARPAGSGSLAVGRAPLYESALKWVICRATDARIV